MENEQVRRIAKRIYENSGGAVKNYVMLEGLIRRFLQLNPDADPEAVDWSAVWDDSLGYNELIQAFREQYPMYKWSDDTPPEEAYSGDKVKEVVEELATKLDTEDFDRLIEELQKLRDEVLDDVRRVEAENVEVAPKPEKPPPAEVKPEPRPQPVEKSTPSLKPSLTLFAKYSFLSTALPLLRAYKLQNVPQEVKQRAVERVFEALERGERGIHPRLEKPWVELLSFPYARALVNYVGDEWLRRRWALAEASRVERLLHGEDDNVLMTVVNELKMNVYRTEKGWTIHFSQYLQLTKRLTTEPRFKLVNRMLDMGLISLTRPELIRLVRERLYDSLSEPKTTPPDWSPEEVRVIREALNKRASKIIAPAPSGEWAPCMVAVRNRVADAGHFALFALAAYMANKGYDVNSIVDVLRVRSDFDERVARYQVEHISGQRGSRVRYKPPSCASMRTHSLCVENGRQCPHGIRNPLQYRPTRPAAGPK